MRSDLLDGNLTLVTLLPCPAKILHSETLVLLWGLPDWKKGCYSIKNNLDFILQIHKSKYRFRFILLVWEFSRFWPDNHCHKSPRDGRSCLLKFGEAALQVWEQNPFLEYLQKSLSNDNTCLSYWDIMYLVLTYP